MFIAAAASVRLIRDKKQLRTYFRIRSRNRNSKPEIWTSVDHYKTLIICNLFQCEQKHRQIKEKNKLFGIP